jgi:hypothetical protein
LYKEKLHYLYCTENIIRVMESRRMRWTGYVERMAEIRNSYKYKLENMKREDCLGDIGGMDLKRKEEGTMMYTGFMTQRRAFVNTVMNFSGTVNGGELLDQLRDC